MPELQSPLAPLATATERALKALDDLGLAPQDEPSRCALVRQLFVVWHDGHDTGLRDALTGMRPKLAEFALHLEGTRLRVTGECDGE